MLHLLILADDTNICMQHNDINCLVASVNSKLVKFSDWFTVKCIENYFIIFC